MFEKRLRPQPWMTGAAPIIAALSENGAARFVGGCVRDSLIGRPIKDVDIATTHTPDKAMALVATTGARVVPTGIDHGTITAILDHIPYEITTLRRDVETFGRHARVAFTDDWKIDAGRRDFTFNAMSCTVDGDFFDPFGGAEDLRVRRVRFVGDAERRIEEDVLRLLRFFRFAAFYGGEAWHCDSLDACAAAADKLPTLAMERVNAEVGRLLTACDPSTTLAMMAQKAILRSVLPEVGNLEAFKLLLEVEGQHGLAVDPVLRLGVLVDGGHEVARSVALRLKTSRSVRERLVAMKVREPLGDDPQSMRVALFACGADTYVDRAVMAATSEQGAMELLPARLAEAANWLPRKLPLTGGDLLARGVSGRQLGELWRSLESWWVERDFHPNRADCLAQVDETLGRR